MSSVTEFCDQIKSQDKREGKAGVVAQVVKYQLKKHKFLPQPVQTPLLPPPQKKETERERERGRRIK
jgi:hypothetical protein